jgi:uncharacterized membrane protein YphA (DoxX/SURF4 family)
MTDAQSSAIRHARLALRVGLGFIWIYEGLVPKLLVPLSNLEKEVVAASGLVPNGIVEPFLHVLGVLEIVLGLLVLIGIQTRALCIMQAAIVGSFTVIIPIMHPTILAHPFGLLSKNVPILGAIIALWFLDNRNKVSANKPE